MRRSVKKDFEMSFSRRGGAVTVARVDVWRAEASKWKHVQQLRFEDPLKPAERLSSTLKAGEYTCVFRGVIEESLNGRFEYEFKVDDEATFADRGDVNTTSSNRDSRVIKDQFILEVVP